MTIVQGPRLNVNKRLKVNKFTYLESVISVDSATEEEDQNRKSKNNFQHVKQGLKRRTYHAVVI